MEFIGYVVKRTDTGDYWNKQLGWNHFPTIYSEKRFATCAGKYHTHKINYHLLKIVPIKAIEIEVKETE